MIWATVTTGFLAVQMALAAKRMVKAIKKDGYTELLKFSTWELLAASPLILLATDHLRVSLIVFAVIGVVACSLQEQELWSIAEEHEEYPGEGREDPELIWIVRLTSLTLYASVQGLYILLLILYLLFLG